MGAGLINMRQQTGKKKKVELHVKLFCTALLLGDVKAQMFMKVSADKLTVCCFPYKTAAIQ